MTEARLSDGDPHDAPTPPEAQALRRPCGYRAVLSAERTGSVTFLLHLDCGHTVKRRGVYAGLRCHCSRETTEPEATPKQNPLAPLRKALKAHGMAPDVWIARLRDPEWVAAFNRGPAKITVRPRPGRHFKAFRVEHGITRAAFAEALGVSPQVVQRLESGRLVTNDAGWAEMQTALFLLASKRGEK